MGKTLAEKNKEYAKKYRATLKKDATKLNEFREKEKERQRLYRKKLKEIKTNLNQDLLKDKRQRDNERQRKSREKKKTKMVVEPYSCRQTLGKAVRKVEKSLPLDLGKKVKVINVLYEKYVKATDDEKMQSNHTLEFQQRLKEVSAFYMHDGISVQSAGRKDTLIIEGQIVAKRFMLMTVSEAYELYKRDCSETVSKSTFFQHRPRNIQLSSKIPHNMCVCMYHANFGFLLQGCSTLIPSISHDFQSFLQSACCNIEEEKCMLNNCPKCVRDIKHDLIPLKYLTQMEESVKWQRWRKVGDRITLTCTTAPLCDLVHELEVELPLFKQHFYVKRAQQSYFQSKKHNLNPDELVLQIDFAENYRLVSQNEVQSAHFSYRQVTIFTCVAWLNGGTRSFAVISDKLTHNKYDVFCFISTLVNQIQAQCGTFSKIFIFSDGSSSQFKNKYIVRSLPDFVYKFECKYLEWNYFATSHGKGAVDGVGAVIKRSVWQITKTKRILLETALDFFECARNKLSGICLIYISSKQIDEFSPNLLEKWKKVSNIPGIQKIHWVSCNDESEIKLANTAYSKNKHL